MSTTKTTEPSVPDPRAPGSNYLPFDVKVGKASQVGNKQIFNKLKEIRSTQNPMNPGFGLGVKR